MSKQTSQNTQYDDRTVAATCIGFSLRKASRAVGQVYDAILEPTGLKGTQFSLLIAASIAGGAPIGRLAEVLVMDRTTLTRNLKPLVGQGYLELVAASDKRVRLVVLTKTGQDVLERARPLWRQAQGVIKAGIGVKTHRQIIENLGRVINVALEK